jgi:hypothetical protein
MSKFKVGDRVAIYEEGTRRVGSVVTVEDTEGDESVVVHDDALEGHYWVHPKQLRLIKPARKPREWFVSKQNLGNTITGFDVWDGDPTDGGWDNDIYGEVIHVREVRPKKGG